MYLKRQGKTHDRAFHSASKRTEKKETLQTVSAKGNILTTDTNI